MPANLQRARELFLHAVGKLPPEQWDAYLAEACGPDAELQRHVLHLLQVHREASSFLERPAAAAAATGVFTPSSEDEAAVVPTEAVGTTIGPYKLIEAIGEGGMGTVWMAQQTAPVKRLVALKVIKPGMDNKQVLARFEAERQALALMDHPNIARVLDAGATAAGRPYFVMELVKGVPLTRYCDEHRLTPRQRLELFVPVCQAVQHAHQKGVIHRDLKPSNVLVAQYDGRPVPKVIDFGIAKATGQQLTEHTLVTGFGAVVGTLEYMSPEQAELNQLDIDTRSDVYSLGVLLYELLTGSTPLEKKRMKEAALLEVLRVIREEEPPRPSTRLAESKDTLASISAQRQTEPAKLTKLMRGELDWIVMKALDKDRSRRYETANGFALDVQRYLADEPVQACPPSAGYRLRKLLRRYKGPVLAAVVILFLLATAIVGTSVGLMQALAAEQQTRQERDDKEEAWRQARQALNTMTDEVMEELLGTQMQLTDKQREFLTKVLEHHAAFAAARADDPEGRHSRADGFYRVGRIRFFLGERNEAEAAYREALALQKQLAEEFPDRLDFRHDLGLSYHHLGMLLHDAHRWKAAAAAYQEAVLLHQQITAESSRAEFRSDLAKSKNGLGYALLVTDQPKEAETLIRDALAIDEQLAREFPDRVEYHQGVASGSHGLAMLLLNTNRPKEAEAVCQQTVTLCQQLTAKFSSRPEFRHALAQNYVSLGVMLQSSRRPREAEKAWRQAATLCRQLAAKFPARTEYRLELAVCMNNLGKLLSDSRRLRDAEEAFGEALALFEQLAVEVPSRPDFRLQVARGRHNMGAVFHQTKRWKEAEEAWRTAVEVGRKLVHDYPDRTFYRQSVILSHGHLALLRQESGRSVQAEETWPEILEFSRPVTHDVDLAAIYSQLGQELESLHGPTERVISLHREALRLDKASAEAHYRLGNALYPHQLEEAIGEYCEAIRCDRSYAEAHTNLGNCFAARGDLEGAMGQYRTALGINKDLFQAHLNLGTALRLKGQLDEAISHYQQAIRLCKDSAGAHDFLGLAWLGQGRLSDALAEFRLAIRLEKNNVKAQEHLHHAERLAQLQARLPAVLEGKDKPKDADELLAFAQLCQPPYRPHYTAATVRFFSAAFARDPKLAENLLAEHRYNAACSAALAGCGQGKDAGTLKDKERARLRRQALDWLRADLDAWGQWLITDPDRARPVMIQQLQHWLADSDFAGVRGPRALSQLPEAERKLWQKLWGDIAGTLVRAQEGTTPEKKSSPK